MKVKGVDEVTVMVLAPEMVVKACFGDQFYPVNGVFKDGRPGAVHGELEIGSSLLWREAFSEIWERFNLGCSIFPLDDFIHASNREKSQHLLEQFRELERRGYRARKYVYPYNVQEWSR